MCRNGTDNINAYYNYDSPDGQCDGGPTEWICILFLALFTATTLVHLIQAGVHKKWFFIPTMVTGGLGELAGWSGRLWGSKNPNSFKAFILQITTTIFSPSFMTAANFIVLGQTIRYANAERYSRLSAKKFTWIFVTFDVTCLFVQSAGGGIASTTNITQAKVGSDIALAGIALQTLAIALYTLLAAEFLWRLSADKPVPGREHLGTEKTSPYASADPLDGYGGGKRIPRNIQLVFVGLGVSTLFFLIRAIYRLAEFADGWGGKIQSTETYFNVLDGGCIIVAMSAINILHPGRLMKEKAVTDGV
ncbi:RTA1 like protein [Clavulina sp. PMI_390]|nr:RTA1 like protein [Clavulina sp. PMI_390]